MFTQGFPVIPKHQIFNGLNTWHLGAVNKLTKNNRSIDKTFSILKDFVLKLLPFEPSEQMYIEDKDDVDMYFKFLIKESDEQAGSVVFAPDDRSHGTIILTIHKGAGVKKTPPLRIGTYGKTTEYPDENTGLYVSFEVTPIQSDGKISYQTVVQFQIKGGE